MSATARAWLAHRASRRYMVGWRASYDGALFIALGAIGRWGRDTGRPRDEAWAQRAVSMCEAALAMRPAAAQEEGSAAMMAFGSGVVERWLGARAKEELSRPIPGSPKVDAWDWRSKRLAELPPAARAQRSVVAGRLGSTRKTHRGAWADPAQALAIGAAHNAAMRALSRMRARCALALAAAEEGRFEISSDERAALWVCELGVDAWRKERALASAEGLREEPEAERLEAGEAYAVYVDDKHAQGFVGLDGTAVARLAGARLHGSEARARASARRRGESCAVVRVSMRVEELISTQGDFEGQALRSLMAQKEAGEVREALGGRQPGEAKGSSEPAEPKARAGRSRL